MSVKLKKQAGFILVLILMLSPCTLYAQETSALFFLPGVPQASLENPALQNNSGKTAIGLPLLSGVYFNIGANSSFNYLYSEIISFRTHRLNEAIDKDGKTHGGLNASIFFASTKYNTFTFSISISERGTLNGHLDKQIIRLIRDGISEFYGTEQNLGTANMKFIHYKEFGIGISKQLWENLDIGIRPKLLFGKYLFNSNDFDVMVTTDIPNRELQIDPQGTYLMSAPFTYQKSFRANIFAGDYFFQPRNLGFALDAGFILRTDHSIEFSASILDLGAINFGHNLFDMKMARPWRFAYEDLVHNPTTITDFGDSISYHIEVTDRDSKILAFLPMRFNAAVKYNYDERTTIGITNQLSLYHNNPVNMFSLFTNRKIGSRVEMAGNLSLYNLSEIVSGIGASYSARRTQLFLATNNILGFIHPSSSKHLNLCFGMNFLFDTQ